MIKVTQKEHHQHIQIDSNEVILSGVPSSLRGLVTIQNSTNEKIFVRDLPLINAQNETLAFPVHATLTPYEIKSQHIFYSVDPQTPPGTYELNLQVGGAIKKVKVIVHENLMVQLSPQQVVLVGIEAGLQHNREILFTNKGNIALTIPTIKHNTLTDMDLICRNLSLAVRSNGDDGIEKTLNAFTKGLKKDITDWVDVSIQEAGQVVEPGKTILLHLAITLPTNINKNFHYSGDIRMFDKLVRYIIINKSPGHNAS